MTEKKTSKFAGIAEKVTRMRVEPDASPAPLTAPPTLVSPSPPKKMGRPPGKKSSEDYVQVTVYLRKTTHTEARKRLLDDRRQFSDLVEELVSRWVGSLEV